MDNDLPISASRPGPIRLFRNGSPAWRFGLAAGGLAMAWLYRRTQSLWPPIAFHALNNCAAFAIVILENASKPLPH